MLDSMARVLPSSTQAANEQKYPTSCEQPEDPELLSIHPSILLLSSLPVIETGVMVKCSSPLQYLCKAHEFKKALKTKGFRST